MLRARADVHAVAAELVDAGAETFDDAETGNALVERQVVGDRS